MSLQDVLSTIQVETVEGELVDEHLARQIDHVSQLSRNAASRCVELLVAAQQDSEVDGELLEELVLLGLAWPKLVVRHGFELASEARRLGEVRVFEGRPEAARVILERAAELFPSHDGLERDLIAVLRSTDDVEALARRCMVRAQAEIDAGRPLDAVPWLRHVLSADPGRRDVARLIRDLRFQVEQERAQGRRVRRNLTIGVLVLLVAGGLGWREGDLRRRYEGLPPADPSSAPSVQIRLAALEAFAAANPYWHGALEVRTEQSSMRVALARLESLAALEREQEATRLRERHAEADRLTRGLETRVTFGQLDLAIEELEQALEIGGAMWPHRERALADLEAIRALQGQTESTGSDQR